MSKAKAHLTIYHPFAASASQDGDIHLYLQPALWFAQCEISYLALLKIRKLSR